MLIKTKFDIGQEITVFILRYNDKFKAFIREIEFRNGGVLYSHSPNMSTPKVHWEKAWEGDIS